jgi:hypothetical protein
MAVSKNILERIGIGLALCVALLMFVSPLVILHGAFAGDESVNGFHVAARMAQLRSGLDAASSGVSPDRADSTGSATESPAITKPIDVPLSLRLASLVPLAIFVAFAFAALALLDLLFIRKGIGTLAFLGGCFSLLAIVHLMLMDSGLRAWTAELIATEPLGPHEDPFVAMRILMAHSFQLTPGPGLHVLTACLFLVAALSYSRAIPRMEAVVRRSPRVESSQIVHVRPLDPALPDETCTSLNISQYGLYLETSATHYYSGMEIRLTRDPDAADSANHEERGSVVRVDKLPDGKRGVAIRIIRPA